MYQRTDNERILLPDEWNLEDENEMSICLDPFRLHLTCFVIFLCIILGSKNSKMDWGNGYTVEPLHNGVVGDRRKWPLQRGLNKTQCMGSLSKYILNSGCCRELVVSGGSIVNCSLSGMTYFGIL